MPVRSPDTYNGLGLPCIYIFEYLEIFRNTLSKKNEIFNLVTNVIMIVNFYCSSPQRHTMWPKLFPYSRLRPHLPTFGIIPLTYANIHKSSNLVYFDVFARTSSHHHIKGNAIIVCFCETRMNAPETNKGQDVTPWKWQTSFMYFARYSVTKYV